VNTDLPADLVAQLDQIKEERGVASRAPIIEEAVRLLIEKQQGA
jgi:metal-responsive CopG/Arc/MetJ family transcriptional regulator